MTLAAARTTSIRVRLLALALAASVPVVLFAAFMVVQLAADRRAREMDDMARHLTTLASAVNQALYGASRELTAMAVDKDLLADNLDGAYQEASAFAALSSLGDAISLVTLDGRMLFNTAHPLGTALPECNDPAGIAETVKARQSVVSGLHADPVDGQPTITINVPVLREGQINYIMHMEVRPERILDILRAQHPHDRWAALVADRDGVVIAGIGGTGEVTARLAPDGLRHAAAQVRSGAYEGEDADGQPVMGVFQRIDASDWVVSLAVPRAQVYAEHNRFLLMLGISATCMLVVAAWLTVRMAGHLERRLLEVGGMARRLGGGLPVEAVATGIRELDAAVGSLSRAATLIASREADLKRASKVAKDALASKAKFFAAANHDLRQPVQSLFLFHATLANMLPEGHPALRPLNYADRSLQALQRLLDGLRDVSRLDAGAVVPVRTGVAVDDMLQPLAEEYRLRGIEQGIALRHVRTGLRVVTDPALLDRVLRNLLENALRYTPPGGRVLLGCRRHGREVRLQVVDTGIGIPGDQLGVIFEEFQQLGNSARDSTLGLGLGLAIVQRTCDLLGHAITVKSVVGKGSAFTLHLPKL